ncbi:hypothetical protein ACQKWADRAFT_297330 [Trichoderma austrokoningii]
MVAAAVSAVISGACQALWALWAASDPRQRQAQHRYRYLGAWCFAAIELSPRDPPSIQIPDFLDSGLGTCRRDLQQQLWDAADLSVLRASLSFSLSLSRNSAANLFSANSLKQNVQPGSCLWSWLSAAQARYPGLHISTTHVVRHLAEHAAVASL